MPKQASSFSGGSSANRKRASPNRRNNNRGTGVGRLLIGMFAGSLLTVLGIIAYFYFGHPPVATADRPAFWEHLTETVPLHRRVAASAKQPPFPAGEDSFEAGARIYRTQCASCHGTPGNEAALGRQMLPHAQQFFGRDRQSTAAKPVGQLFWPTAFGIRHSGMPAYNRTLSNTDLWNLALLLHSADQELPDPVRNLLAPTIPATPPTAAKGAGGGLQAY